METGISDIPKIGTWTATPVSAIARLVAADEDTGAENRTVPAREIGGRPGGDDDHGNAAQ